MTLTIPGRALLIALAIAVPLGTAEAGTRSGLLAGVRAETRYDENLQDGGADGAGLLQPTLGWYLQSPTFDFEAGYALDVVRYASGGAGRGGFNHRVSALQELQLDSRTVFLAREGAERVYDPTALSRPGVVRATGTSTYGYVDAEVQHRLTPRWVGGIAYRGELATLEAPQAVDGAVHAPRVWATRSLSRRDLLGGAFRLQLFDTFGGTDALSYEPSLNYVHLFAPTTRIELEAGPAFYAEQASTVVVPRGRIALSHRRPRLTLQGGYERALVGSTGFEGALWSDSLMAAAFYRVRSDVRLMAAGGAFRNGRAPDGESFVEGFASELSVEWNFAPQLTTELSWRRVLQADVRGDEAVDLSRNIFALGLTWQLPGGRLER